MLLEELHLLLTYQCNFECDHCFVWGSPQQSKTMTLADIRNILNQAKMMESIEWIYFEGGEPFLYYPILVKAVQEANQMGFKIGIVSNSYWGNDIDDACVWLQPFLPGAGIDPMISDLSISSDLYHYDEKLSRYSNNSLEAAQKLGIPVGVISIAQPDTEDNSLVAGKLPHGESTIMYRGRAAQKLAPGARKFPWDQFTQCPFEDLINPSRVHVDPLGFLHICQGISIGNMFNQSLQEICDSYDASLHPITAPLVEHGPVGLVETYSVPHEPVYADACHLCDEVRRYLRSQFREYLTPDEVYGIF